MTAQSSGDFITLALVVKTQGRHGEVGAEVHTDVPDRFSPGMKLSALSKQGDRREVEIEELWPHKGLLILKFAGVDSMTDAEALVGSELQVPKSERGQLETGWIYVSDLVGCSIFDHDREIGEIADVQFGAGEAPLLVVRDSAGKVLEVPFAEAYVASVDGPQRQVRMRFPEGMLEINAPMTREEKKEQAAPRKRH